MPSATFVPPATQHAIVANENEEWIVTKSSPVPDLLPDSALVRVEAVAINPSDTKMLGDFQTPGAVLGTDYAGTIVALGANLVGGNLSVGDRIAGAALGMNKYQPSRGAFAEYVVTESDVFLRLPPTMTVEQGASMPAGVCTMGLALRALGLPTPDEPASKPFKVLVYGGSTASGTLVMQLLRLANLIPITTCSPRNFGLARKYGAEVAFDYSTPTCAADIRAYCKNNLAYAIDCITTVESTSCCYAAIGRAGGKYCALDPYPEHAATRQIIKPDWVLGPTIFGKAVGWPGPYDQPGKPEVKEFASVWFDSVQRLLDQGKLRTHPLRVMTGPLETVIEGMAVLRSGVISGEKIVVKLQHPTA